MATEREELVAVIREAVGPDHDPEFLIDAGHALARKGFLGPRATLVPAGEPADPPVFVSLDVGGNPSGCATCAEPYSYSDGWGIVKFCKPAGRVAVVLCASCHGKVRVAKGGA